jgi:hypothetical protein
MLPVEGTQAKKYGRPHAGLPAAFRLASRDAVIFADSVSQ